MTLKQSVFDVVIKQKVLPHTYITNLVKWVCFHCKNCCVSCSLDFIKLQLDSKSHLPISAFSGYHCMCPSVILHTLHTRHTSSVTITNTGIYNLSFFLVALILFIWRILQHKEGRKKIMFPPFP